MNRCLKSASALIALVLTTAIAAQAASAAEFTASAYPVSVLGSVTAGEEVFTTEAGSIECAAEYTGSSSEASSTLALHPEYTDCKAFGFVTVSRDTEECDWLFHLDEEGPPFTATADLVCPEGQSIKITAASCAAEIVPQTGLETVDFANDEGSLEMSWTVEDEIDYTVTKDGLFCPFGGTGAKEGASYVSESSAPLSGSASLDIG